MTISENDRVAQKILRHEDFTMILHPIGIVELQWKEDTQSVSLSMMKDVVLQLGDWGNGTKYPVYISTQPFLTVDEDARKFVATEEGQRYTLANATLVDNLAKRILYNFFIRFTKMPTPTRAFKSRQLAFEWLETFL